MKYVKLIIIGLIISAIFVILGCIWLSLSMETFDKIAEMFGAEEGSFWNPPIPDYELPGFEGNVMVNIIIGIIFTIIVFMTAYVVGHALKVKKQKLLKCG